MTLRTYLRVLRERWKIIAVCVVLSMAATTSAWFLVPREYTANLRMYVSAQSIETTSAAYQGAQLSEQRVTSYVELVSSTRVSQEVIDRLNLSVTPEELSKRIAATSKLDSVVIDVAVTGRAPAEATAIANVIGNVFPDLVDQLERPSSPAGTPPVIVRVVEPATSPTDPSSIGLPLAAALALLSGLVIGMVAAIVRDSLDTTIKSPDQLSAVAAAPNLGVLAYDSVVPKRPLTVHEDPQSARAEAFRQLRTNLQFLNVDSPRKAMIITSSLPGEGKTTTAANLAIAVASAGLRTLVIEGDLRRPKLSDVLGLDRSVGLTSVLAGRLRCDQAIQHWSGGVFDVLASGPLPPNPSELLASQHMANLLTEVRTRYDLVLLDTPPLLPVTDAAAVAASTDGALMICRYKSTTREQVESAAAALRAVGAPLLGTIFTMVPANGPRAYAKYNTYYRSNHSESLPKMQGHRRGQSPRSVRGTT